MLFQRNTFQLLQLRHTSYVNWYLKQFYMEIHVNICTSQSNKSFFFLKKKKKTLKRVVTASSFTLLCIWNRFVK